MADVTEYDKKKKHQKNTTTGYSIHSKETAIPSILLSGAEWTEC